MSKPKIFSNKRVKRYVENNYADTSNNENRISTSSNHNNDGILSSDVIDSECDTTKVVDCKVMRKGNGKILFFVENKNNYKE